MSVPGTQYGAIAMTRLCLFSTLILTCQLTVAAERAPRIVGGSDATEDYPWMSALHVYLPNDGENGSYIVKPFCGGSLIAPGWVVTAAHCITSPGNGANPANYDQAAEDTIVRVDRPDLADQPQFFVTALIAHPEYGVADGSDDSDIALVQLADKANVATVSLADDAIMNQLETSVLLNDVVRIMGWGIYDDEEFDPANAGEGNQPDYLQSVDIDYLPFRTRKCRRAWGGLTANMICAWEPNPPVSASNGQDSCFGDSGGPLLLPTGKLLSSGPVSDDWLLGATSFGSTTCNSTTNPGIYTRLSNFAGWIEQTTLSAGDALVDIVGGVSAPAEVRPDQAFIVTATLTNNSVSNSATTPVIDITAADTTLTPVDATGCTGITHGWRCTLANTAAGQQRSRDFSAIWTGADEATFSTSVKTFATQDDYRIANNSAQASAKVTLLPNPSLTPFVVSSKRGTRATVSVTANNLSLLNSASDVELNISFPATLTISADADCTQVSATEISCALGTLAAQDSVPVTMTLEGEGRFTLSASLQNSNGDAVPGDLVRNLDITLKKSSSGGSLPGTLLLTLLALVYLRRNARSQLSN
jgi:secreted trypsin-like serine protease